MKSDTIEARTADNIPKIVIISNPLVDKPLKAGQVELNCTAQGYPQPKVYWKKSGKKIDKMPYNFELNEKTQGEYVCLTSNYDQTVSSRVYVKFLQKPKLLNDKPSLERKTHLSSNVTANITCSFSGWPNKITWLKNEKEIKFQEFGNYHLSLFEFIDSSRNLHVTKLNFHPVYPGDNANYTCVGKNDLGKENGSLSFSLTEGQEGPFRECCENSGILEECKDKCRQYIIKESSCRQEISRQKKCISLIKVSEPTDVEAKYSESCLTISWFQVKRNLVRNYKIYAKEKDSRSLTYLTQSINQSYCIQSNLDGDTQYEFSVQSIGQFQNSSKSTTAKLKTPEEKPGPPKNLITSINGSKVTVSWSRPEMHPYLVKRYQVEFYKQVDTTHPVIKILKHDETSYKFEIDLSKTYTVQVQSEGSLGNSTKQSHIINPNPKLEKTSKKKDDGQNPAVIAIPIILVLLVIGAAVGAFWWFRIRRPFAYSNSSDEHRVAFENPGYGNIGTDGVVNIKPGSGEGYGE